jgi:DNA-binding response OmpR family regulator
MQNCNILIIEDDAKLRAQYLRHFGDNVKVFRDLTSFEQSFYNSELLNGLKNELPLILIIDIMLAIDLNPRDQIAKPFLYCIGESKEINLTNFVDYNLGLKIAKQIRNSLYSPLIKNNTPILFVTARKNDAIIDEIFYISNSYYIFKPFWFDELDKRIAEIIEKDQAWKH